MTLELRILQLASSGTRGYPWAHFTSYATYGRASIVGKMCLDIPHSPNECVDHAHHRCIGVEMAPSSRSGVTAVRGTHASYAWSTTRSLVVQNARAVGTQVVLKPSPIECRNCAPNELQEADRAMLLGEWGLHEESEPLWPSRRFGHASIPSSLFRTYLLSAFERLYRTKVLTIVHMCPCSLQSLET